MKYYINQIIVVEGKEDVSYLSSFVEAEYVVTNGYEIPKEEVEYLNTASNHKGILVLLDPDEAGKQIEAKVKKSINQATYLHVDIHKCSRGKKDGVAECEKEEIIKVLKQYFSIKNPAKSGYLQENSLKITLNNKELRKYLSSKYHLGKCNCKKIIERLQTLEISEEELMSSIKEYYGD